MCRKYFRFGNLIQGNKFFINQLDEIGLKTCFTGYYYVVDILDIVINKGLKQKSFSKYVYPKIAEKYNTNECTVERNIRNLIAKNWNDDMQAKLKWNNEQKPSCKKFVFIIKDYIMSKIT